MSKKRLDKNNARISDVTKETSVSAETSFRSGDVEDAFIRAIFPGGSEMASRMRAFDWSTTDLGPPQSWPENLRITARICLTSRFPILIWWGPNFRILYNDAYIPFLGEQKHPRCLGQPGRECWQEIWETIGPMLEGVYRTGEATWSDDSQYFFARKLPREEVYVTFTYGPILSADGDAVEGIFCPCTETTEKIVGARRLDTLRKLGVLSLETGAVEAACEEATRVLAENPYDIPFAAIYLVNGAGTHAELKSLAGFPQDAQPFPSSVSVSEGDIFPWPLASALQARRAAETSDLISAGLRLPGGPWPEPASKAVVLPIFAAERENLSGLAVFGVSPRLVFDDAYRTFFDLIAGHIGTAISDAKAYEATAQSKEGEGSTIMMPRLDGFGLLKELRADEGARDIPVIMLSARAGEESRVEGLYASVDDYFIKPFSARELAARVDSQLGQVQARRTIAKSDERFRALVEASVQIVWTASADGEVVEDSPSWRAYTGQTHEQRLGRGWLEALHPEDRGPTAELWRRAVAEKFILNTEYRLRHVSGEWRWTAVRAVPILNSAGSLNGWVGMNTDITDRKRAEVVMAQMAAIVESSDDAIISKDLNGIIVSWNKGAEKLFGYKAAEAIGKPIAILLPSDRVDEESQLLERIRRGEPVEHYETVRRRKDGHEIDISLTVSPIRDKTGKVIGASKIARDITERKRIEIEREELLLKESEARAEADAANHSKDEFLAMVSHELRSPLNAILGYNQILRENPQDESRLKLSCDIIERNARTQLQLIEDLLDIARIVSGKLRLEMRALDINRALTDALDVVRPTAEAKGVQLRIGTLGLRKEDGATREESAIPESQSAIVLGDAARLQQTVWNLLSNAIKFTPAGGRVELRTERSEDHIRIIVSDTGKGIHPDFLPYVFDRFCQADSSSSRRYGGLGLGLALVKHLVDLHGGKVEVASDGVGRGATFSVTLPLATQSESVTAEPPALAALAALTNGAARTDDETPEHAGLTIAGVRVLVVDDQEDARASLADYLNRCGAIVTTVSSGAEALAILSNPPGGARPDILLCDIAMPDEDGYAALCRMRALETARGVATAQRIPAVALTAFAGNEERLRALSAGFQLHIAKPADPVELVLAIANISGMWRRERKFN